MSALENLGILYDGTEIMIPETLLNDSLKRRGANSKRTCDQLEYIINCMDVGDRNKENKMSPSFSCRLMKVIGTVEGHAIAQYPFTAVSRKGYPNFCKKDTLDLMQIKGYFGQQIPFLKAKLAKMRKKITENANVEDDDEEDATDCF